MTNKAESWFYSFFFDKESITDNSAHRSICFQIPLLIYRIIFFIYMTAVVMIGLINGDSVFTFVKYLTNNGVFLAWIYSCLVVSDYFLNQFKLPCSINSELQVQNQQNTNNLQKPKRQSPEKKRSPMLKYWVIILFQLSISLELTIVIIYWATLYNPVYYSAPGKEFDFAMNINVHAICYIGLIIDLIFNSFDFYCKRVMIGILYGILYGILNMGYTIGIRPIYQIIDWVSVMSYVYFFGAILISVIMFLIGKLVYCCKKRCLESRIFKAQDQSINQMDDSRRKQENIQGSMIAINVR